MSTPLAIAFLTAGYIAGRTRPLHSIKRRVWLRTIVGQPSRTDQVLFMALHPVVFTRAAIKTRGAVDAPLRAPAPQPNPKWAELKTEEDRDA